MLQPFFDKLIKRKWLNNTEAFEAIESSIKQHFKKFRRMDCPPYQVAKTDVLFLVSVLDSICFKLPHIVPPIHMVYLITDRRWWVRCTGGSWWNMSEPSCGEGSSAHPQR